MDNTPIAPAVAALPYTLRAIYVRNSETWMDPQFDPLLPGQQLAGVFRTGEGSVDCRETTFETENGQFHSRSCMFITRFDFAYRRGDPAAAPSDEDIEKSLVAKISVEFAADYLINTAAFPDSESLQRWGNSNVLLQTWPYWREFCHATLLRMGLPVTIIPMIQLSNNPEKPQPSEPQKASKKPRRNSKQSPS